MEEGWIVDLIVAEEWKIDVVCMEDVSISVVGCVEVWWLEDSTDVASADTCKLSEVSWLVDLDEWKWVEEGWIVDWIVVEAWEYDVVCLEDLSISVVDECEWVEVWWLEDPTDVASVDIFEVSKVLRLVDLDEWKWVEEGWIVDLIVAEE